MEKHFKYLFSIVIFLMLLIGVSSIYFLVEIYFTTKNMYEHPYAVSNKLKEIKISMHQIHLSTLSIDELDIRDIGKKDSLNRENLHVIATQYLGDKNNVAKVNDLYEQWLSTRVYGSDIAEQKEQQLFEELSQAIEVLSDFADNKAIEFYNDATKDAIYYSSYIGASLVFSIILSIILLLRTLRYLREISKSRKQYLYLIDQNVMMSAMDDEGTIFDISNQLGRYLSEAKEALVGKSVQDVFFENDEAQYLEMWQQINSGAEWHGEIEVIKGNESKWLGVDVLPIQNDDYSSSGFRLLANDITSRKSLELISITDTLTGLLNRRTLDETLDRMSKLSSRMKMPLTVAIFDIDYFKQYNDTYGHIAGDKVLSRITYLVSKMFARPSDYVFRIGGEEFCIIFNAKNAEESNAHLERACQAVKNLAIRHESSTVDDCVTISIGAIFFEGQEHIDGKMLLSYSDDNMYVAKEKRNHTVQTEYGFKS